MRKTTPHWIIIALLVFWKILHSKCRLLVPGGHCKSFVSSGDWPSLKTVTRISSNNIASSSFYQLLNKSHVIHLERRRPMSSFLVPPMHLLQLTWQPSDDKTEKWKVSMPLTLMLNGETCVCWIAENRWRWLHSAVCSWQHVLRTVTLITTASSTVSRGVPESWLVASGVRKIIVNLTNLNISKCLTDSRTLVVVYL